MAATESPTPLDISGVGNVTTASTTHSHSNNNKSSMTTPPISGSSLEADGRHSRHDGCNDGEIYSEEGVIRSLQILYGSTGGGMDKLSLSSSSDSPLSAFSYAHQYLSTFQQHHTAWRICISLLNLRSDAVEQEMEAMRLQTREAINSISDVQIDDNTDLSNSLSTSNSQTKNKQRVALSLLLQHDSAISDLPRGSVNAEAVYFASQTLCAQAQAGFPQQLELTKASHGITYCELRDGLCNLLFRYRFGPKAVIRQLAIALSCTLIFGNGQPGFPAGSAALEALLVSFVSKDAGEEGYGVLMTFLSILAEELSSKKLAISSCRRQAFVEQCLRCTPHVLQAATRVYIHASIAQQRLINQYPHLFPQKSTPPVASQTSLAAKTGLLDCALTEVHGTNNVAGSNDNGNNSSNIDSALGFACNAVIPATLASPSPLMGMAMKCLASWMGAHFIFLRTLAGTGMTVVESHAAQSSSPSSSSSRSHCQNTSSVVSEEDMAGAMGRKILALLSNEQMFLICLKNLRSSDVEMLEIVNEALVHMLGLTSHPTSESISTLRMILAAYEQLANQLAAEVQQTPNGIKPIDGQRLRSSTHALLEFAKVHLPYLLHEDERESGNAVHVVCSLMIELLSHDDLTVKEQSLDFFYSFLYHTLQAKSLTLSSCDDHKSDEDSKKKNLARLEEQRARLRPIFVAFVGRVVAEVAHPQELDNPQFAADFNFEAWTNFRDSCTVNLTESTLVVSHRYLLDLAGRELSSIVAGFKEATSHASSPSSPALSQQQQSHAPPDWRRMEACLYVLATVAPRAPAGGDTIIPMALNLLPQIPFPTTAAVPALILRAAAARLVLWTAGYIGTQRTLFANLFQLLACNALPFITSLSLEPDSALEEQRLISESLLVEAINALTASSGYMLATEAEEGDVNVVLNALTSLIVAEKMVLENRASLVVAAGSVLSHFNKSKMRELHAQLVEPLAANLRIGLMETQAGRSPSSVNLKESIKLFFTAISAVRPLESYPPPPPVNNRDNSSSNEGRIVPLYIEPGSVHSHPVLDVVSSQWKAIEDVFSCRFKTEGTIDQACHSMVVVFSHCRSHATRYVLLYSFFELLGKAYRDSPSCFHLGALRTTMGIFAYSSEDAALEALCGSLRVCVEATMAAMQRDGELFILNQPDLVGMTVDCVNIALMHCFLSKRILRTEWFFTLLQAVLQFTPSCHHPKVLHCYMVLLSRVVGWVDPPPQMYSYRAGGDVPWLKEPANESSKLIRDLLLHPINKRGQSCLFALVDAVIKAITNVHAAVQSWIGNATQVLLPLLLSADFAEDTKKALHESIQCVHPDLMSNERQESFFNQCISIQHPREFCDMLQRAADESRADYKRSQFRGPAAAVGGHVGT